MAANEQGLGLSENAADDDALTSSPDNSSENHAIIMSSQDSTSSQEDDGQFQESGYQTSSETNSPTENGADFSMSSFITPPPKTESTPLSCNAPTKYPPLPTFPTTPTSSLDDRTKKSVNERKGSGLCTQGSLDLFAFKKGRTFKEEVSQIETAKISPTRTILADRSSPNFKTRRKLNESPVNEVEDESVKENNGNTSKDGENKEQIKQNILKVYLETKFFAG